LAWRTVYFSFVGTGGVQEIALISTASQFDAAGRGAYIDDITIDVYDGYTQGSVIDLSGHINSGLVDTDGSEVLSIEISGIPTGFTLSDGMNPIAISGGVATVTPAQLLSLELTPTSSYYGKLQLEINATSSELSNGDTASTEDTLIIEILPDFDNPVSILYGGSGNDTMVGTNAAQHIYGGAGSDILTGGGGADTFYWQVEDGNSVSIPVDIITDFSLNGGGADKLDLSGLLQGEENNPIENYFNSITFSGGNTTLQISSNGDGVHDQTIVMEGVNLTTLGPTIPDILDTMITNGQLIVDT
ncbi:MAG: type I secretion C-terminal target domain-containing protein, partial [Chlamydiia bacterium]|nr:type I secretion C-terminal target domain-containing protein [Chlamydiia bacterium]